jgi:predicted transport protein
VGDIRIFCIDGAEPRELKGSSVALEKSLQTYIENNLESLVGVTFLASEHSTGKTHGGRIDTLGIDENGFPVIIEYKRATNENVINQGLYYLDWLLDHKAEFEMMVRRKMGEAYEEKIDWSGPRLLCIAGDFTKYDLHAVQQINRNIDLVRYRKFDDNLLLLELVTTAAQNRVDVPKPIAVPAEGTEQRSPHARQRSPHARSTFSEILARSAPELRDRFEALKACIEALGDDVQMKELKYYVAFRRIKNFACVELRISKSEIVVWVSIDPDTVKLKEGFTRDVRGIGHYGTGDLEILIRSDEDLERAKPLILQSYESN